MTIRSSFAGAAVALVCAAAAVPQARAVVLYDAAAGTTPAAQGWTVLAGGAAPSQAVVAGEYRLDTTGAGVVAFGHARQQPLDTATGFDLAFRLRIDAEAHTSDNRAGYSVLFVGSDPSRALEIGFWSDRVWVYDFDASDPDRFVRGPSAALDTGVMRDWRLAVRNGSFSLWADGNWLLGGALRDYRAEGLPYTVPGLLFFGDDTSRGSSVSALAQVELLPVPEPSAAWLLAAGLAALALRRRAAAGRG
jgi:hypothetical protein